MVGIPVANDVFPLPFTETVEAAFVLGLSLHRQARFAHQDDIASAAFDHLEFDRLGPDLVRTVDVVKNAAIPRFAVARCVGLFAPLEDYVQVIVLVFLFSAKITELHSRYVDRPVLHAENVAGVVVLPVFFEIGVKAIQIFPVKQLHLWSELRISSQR